MSTTVHNRSKRSIIFPVFAIALFFICGILTAVGLFRLYKMAAAYELSSPESCVRAAISLFQKGDYDEIISLGEISLSEFETISDLKNAIQSAAPEGSFTFSRLDSESYSIMRGDTQIATLSLSCQKGAGEYGLDIWHTKKLLLTCVSPENYTITVSQSLAPKVNGIALYDKLIDYSDSKKLENELFTDFGSLPEELSPQSPSVYHIEGLYQQPVITVDTPKKSKSIVRKLETNYSVLLYPTGDVIDNVSEVAVAAAETYARYITNDATLDDVLPYFLPESQYYRHLKEFYNGWYNIHDSYSFEEPRFADWKLYDDDHLSCVIIFNYIITMGYHQYEYPSKYKMNFVKTTDGWRLSNLVVV